MFRSTGVNDLLEPDAVRVASPVLRGGGYSNVVFLPGGRYVGMVSPRNTSQNCSGCGRLVEKTLSERVHRCPHNDCGLVLDRDLNAALNILRLGLQSVGIQPI